jgi:hypothetical protein
MTLSKPGASALALMLLAACESQPQNLKLGSEESFDGLRIVQNTIAHRVWVREDLDLSGYDQMILKGAGIKYRHVRSAGTSSTRASRREFPVTPEQQQRLLALAEDVFRTELANSERFTITETAGPNVLLVEGALIDVVSFVPPEPAGRGDTFLSRIGEATLVVQVSDSLTGEALARMVDRRGADPVNMQRSSRPFNRSEMQRLLSRWARQLREGLDTLHDWTPAED